MKKQHSFFVDHQQASSTRTVPAQPEISHRTLTEAEASAIWRLLRSSPLPNDLRELRIVVLMEGQAQARGWVAQVSPSGPSLSSPLSAEPTRK